MTAGPLLFARYAFPPNELGYCGPADYAALRGYGAAAVTDPGLVQLAKGFTGAWPYLQVIAAANHIADPLDPRVVEAYWVGNSLLSSVRMRDFGDFLDESFRPRAGRGWEPIAAAVPGGAVPHHSFHVFCVYPWTGLLREGRTNPSLEVLDRCRISWGQVITAPDSEPVLDGSTVLVRQRPLTWDGRTLGFGPPSPHLAKSGFVGSLQPGDWVSLHWDRVCDRLTPVQLRALRRFTARHLGLANAVAPLLSWWLWQPHGWDRVVAATTRLVASRRERGVAPDHRLCSSSCTSGPRGWGPDPGPCCGVGPAATAPCAARSAADDGAPRSTQASATASRPPAIGPTR